MGLETDLRLKNAACDAVARYGVQFASSRAYVSCPPYAELERLLGAMFEAPLVVAQTTTLAHFAALPILVGSEDAVICDQLVHHSVQAVLPTLQAAGTTCRFVRHSRMDRLDDMVSKLAARHRRVWYLADGVYSMHGDPAPQAALHELVSRHEQLHLYVDDAHGLSWAGRHGRGTVLGDGPLPPRTVMVASLAKAFSAGGAVMVFPDAETARLVRTCGSTMIFSGPLQPALLGAAIASARIHLSNEIHERQSKLMDRILLFNSLAEDTRHSAGVGGGDADPLRQDGRQRHDLPDRRRADERRLLRQHRGVPGGVGGQRRPAHRADGASDPGGYSTPDRSSRASDMTLAQSLAHYVRELAAL